MRNDIHEEVDKVIVFGLSSVLGGDALVGGVKGAHVNIHARAGLNQVYDHQADDQGQQGYAGKVDDCKTARSTHGLDVVHARDTSHNCGKNERRDDHFNQVDEHFAQRLHLYRHLRIKMAQQNTYHDCNQHLYIEHSQILKHTFHL